MITQPDDGTDASRYARVRVSDADREHATDMLKEAFAEGRLTQEEHAKRVERAYGSRTYAELAAVSSDLPAGPLGTLPSPAQRDPARSLPRPAGRTNPLAIASRVSPRAGIEPFHGQRHPVFLPVGVGPLRYLHHGQQ